MRSKILTDLSVPALVAAIEANMFEFRALLGRMPGAAWHDEGDVLWLISRVPHYVFNSVFSARFEPEEADALIEEVLAPYKARKTPLAWWTGPASRPPDLGERLMAHGLVHHGDLAGMAVDLGELAVPAVPAGLSVVAVRDEGALREYTRVFETFGLPEAVGGAYSGLYADLGIRQGMPWVRYLGLWRGEPVAIAEIFMGAGVVGVYGVATIERARRRGIGTALTAVSLLEARRRGYRVGVLHGAEMGRGVYRRLGFRPYCTLSQSVVFWEFPW